MNETDYETLSRNCREIAAQFRWEQVAADTIREYQAALESVKSRDQHPDMQTVSA